MGTIADLLNTAMRDFQRYSGDGLPGEPVGRPLPFGDPASGQFNPPKKQVREAFLAIAETADVLTDAAQGADLARDAAALSAATSTTAASQSIVARNQTQAIADAAASPSGETLPALPDPAYPVASLFRLFVGPGVKIYRNDADAWVDTSFWAKGPEFDTGPQAIADTSDYPDGTLIRTSKEGFVYLVDSTSTDLETASGVKLRVLKGQEGRRALSAFGLDATGITNEAAGFDVAAATGPLTLGGGTFRLEDYAPSNKAVRVYGPGVLKTDKLSDNVLWLNAGFAHEIFDVEFKQSNDPGLAPGEANDHSCLKFSGSRGARGGNLKFTDPDLCLSVGFGPVAMADRASKDCNINNVLGTGVRGMGLEVFGSQSGHFLGHTYHGDNGSGGRAMFHGLRLVAFDFAPNEDNEISVTASNFANGLSVQRNSRNNKVSVHADNCGYAADVFGALQGVPLAEVSSQNDFSITARNCDKVLRDGASYNTFRVHAKTCEGGIEQSENGGTTGLSVGSHYEGSLEDIAGRLAWLRGDENTFDLVLSGRNTTDATFGLLLSGNRNVGRAIIRTCGVGFLVSGSGNCLTLVSKDCTSAGQITGNNNVVFVNTDGNISITGNNNTVLGYVGGTITNGGTGNDVLGVQGRRLSKRYIGQSTDDSGFLTITHNLGFAHTVSATVIGQYQIAVTSTSNTSTTIRLFTPNGTAVSGATGLVVDLQLMAI